MSPEESQRFEAKKWDAIVEMAVIATEKEENCRVSSDSWAAQRKGFSLSAPEWCFSANGGKSGWTDVVNALSSHIERLSGMECVLVHPFALYKKKENVGLATAKAQSVFEQKLLKSKQGNYVKSGRSL